MFVLLSLSGGLDVRTGALVGVWFAASVWAQFFSTSAIVAAAGLGLQTLLAIYLLVRWRLYSNP